MPNGLFSAHGELRPSWVPFSAHLHDEEFDALLLTEAHLQPSSGLPADDAFRLCSAPPRERRGGRRDTAIATSVSSESWCALPGEDVDISGALQTSARPQVRLISAYVPDSSRGPVARAEFFDRFEAALHRWHVSDQDVITVICMDANTWDMSLDPSRRSSPDLPRLTAILSHFQLYVMNESGRSTHRSGTVIDWVVTSHPEAITSLHVHSSVCNPGCPLHPACYPALGSDHALITFEVRSTPISPTTPPSRPRLLHCDWDEALLPLIPRIRDQPTPPSEL